MRKLQRKKFYEIDTRSVVKVAVMQQKNTCQESLFFLLLLLLFSNSPSSSLTPGKSKLVRLSLTNIFSLV
jgi:hypothetical protein